MSWPTIDPGKMRHQITIWGATETGFDASGAVTKPSVVATAWAEIEPVSQATGGDKIQSGQAVTQLYLKVKIWYQPGIEPNMIVEAPAGRYIIQSIDNVSEMNVVLILNCQGTK